MELGDRMKNYEGRETKGCAMPGLPVVIRLDGKTFSKWTKGLARPFDVRLSALMVDVTKELVDATHALIGYTQSDEITLILPPATRESEMWLGGKFQKLVSVTAAMATAHFNAGVPHCIPERVGRLAFFDSRAWAMPTEAEAVNALLWRELDASKNSVSMAARHYYSHRELQGKNGSEMQDLLHEKDVNWNDYPSFFKRGTFVRRVVSTRKLSPDEIDALPEKHAARTNPDLEVTRSRVLPIAMPSFRTVTNRNAVVFEGADPETAAQ